MRIDKKKVGILLTCGRQLWKEEDFLYCRGMGIRKFRIHLGKMKQDSLSIARNLWKAKMNFADDFDMYIDLPTTRPRLGSALTFDDGIIISKGQVFNIVYEVNSDWEKHLPASPYNILIRNFEKYQSTMANGDRVEIKDGSYCGIVEKANTYGMTVKCISDVKLCDSESLVFPDKQFEYEIFDNRIYVFLQAIKDEGIVANKFILSFSHTGKMIKELRDFLSEYLGYHVEIMAKVEDKEGVRNIAEIATEADEILIGRGDLGPTVGFEKLTVIQQRLVEQAQMAHKPVYVATQFLDELAQKDHLCSPELNDIFSAIAQNVDGIMLAGEAGGSPNSRRCINVLSRMIKKYEQTEVYMNNTVQTKILATMGPTLQNVNEVKQMIERDVEEFRVHMGLRTRDFCGYFRNAREASKQMGREINVLLDLPSSRPRVVDMLEHIFDAEESAYIYDAAAESLPRSNFSNIPIPNLREILPAVRVGEHVLFRDGHVVFEIIEKSETYIRVKCLKSDLCIKTGASICFPESDIHFRPIEEIDIDYLKRMQKEGLCPDRVAISFASSKESVDEVSGVLEYIWPGQRIGIICKIESRLGLKNVDELIEQSDGIMIARGDLLLCIDPYELPKIQQTLAKKCNEKGKQLIIATEFFERYAESGIVNRAELSDVALAVRQGADSIMLARETGNSKFSLGCVELINKIITNELM